MIYQHRFLNSEEPSHLSIKPTFPTKSFYKYLQGQVHGAIPLHAWMMSLWLWSLALLRVDGLPFFPHRLNGVMDVIFDFPPRPAVQSRLGVQARVTIPFSRHFHQLTEISKLPPHRRLFFLAPQALDSLLGLLGGGGGVRLGRAPQDMQRPFRSAGSVGRRDDLSGGGNPGRVVVVNGRVWVVQGRERGDHGGVSVNGGERGQQRGRGTI